MKTKKNLNTYQTLQSERMGAREIKSAWEKERERKRLIEFSKAVAAAVIVVVEHLKTVCDVWMSVGHVSNSIRQSDQFRSFFFFFSAFITYILSVCVSCLRVCVREQINHHCGFCINSSNLHIHNQRYANSTGMSSCACISYTLSSNEKYEIAFWFSWCTIYDDEDHCHV